MAFSLACSDSTAPNIELTEDQVNDMMDAFSAIQTTPDGASASNIAALIVTRSISVGCPNGGTMTGSETANSNEETSTITYSTTLDFSACKATSSEGRLWTFDGNPNLTSSFTVTVNAETSAFNMTGSQTGGLRVASDLGSGVCNFNVSYAMSTTPVPGTEDEFTFTGSVTGTVCGRSIEVDLSVEP